MNKFNMKIITIISIIVCPIIIENSLHCSGASIPISQPLTPDNKQSLQGLLDNVSSNPTVVIDDETNQLIQIPVNRISHFMLPDNTITIAQKSNLSILRPTDPTVYKNYPNGSSLFPKNSDVAQQFDATIKAIQGNNELIKFFRKIHFNCLNQMYVYLMRIHTNLVVRHVGTSRDNKGNLIIDTKAVTADDIACATNQKTLVVSLLVNLIESQFHAMIIACSPKLPYLFATPAGKILVQNDFGTDLSTFALPQDDDILQQIQLTYLSFFKQYVTFFQTYNNLLTKPDATSGFTQFASVAQSIQNSNVAAQMNPAMFFYNDETMRAIKMIPYIASTLPEKMSSIGWAQDAIDAATKGTMNKNNPVAYFKDAANNITKDVTKAAHLFIISMSGDNMFEEELLAQPDWLNSSQGIINMLQACLGDFSKIIPLNILDPFTQAVLEKSINGSVSPLTLQGVTDFSVALAPTKNALTPSDNTPLVSPTSADTATNNSTLSNK